MGQVLRTSVLILSDFARYTRVGASVRKGLRRIKHLPMPPPVILYGGWQLAQPGKGKDATLRSASGYAAFSAYQQLQATNEIACMGCAVIN